MSAINGSKSKTNSSKSSTEGGPAPQRFDVAAMVLLAVPLPRRWLEAPAARERGGMCSAAAASAAYVRAPRRRIVRVIGLGESTIETRLHGLQVPGMTIGFRTKMPENVQKCEKKSKSSNLVRFARPPPLWLAYAVLDKFAWIFKLFLGFCRDYMATNFFTLNQNLETIGCRGIASFRP